MESRQASMQTERHDILLLLTDDERLSLFKELVSEPSIRDKAVAMVLARLAHKVDVAAVEQRVFAALYAMDERDLWRKYGRNTYVDPGDDTESFFNETIGLFAEELLRYRSLNLIEQATSFLAGILRGLNRFEAANNDFLSWIPDAPMMKKDELLMDFSTWAPEENVRKVHELCSRP